MMTATATTVPAAARAGIHARARMAAATRRPAAAPRCGQAMMSAHTRPITATGYAARGSAATGTATSATPASAVTARIIAGPPWPAPA